MIPEAGDRNELKRWLLQELWITNCYNGHRSVVCDEIVWDAERDPMELRERQAFSVMCFYCSVDIEMIVKNENARLLGEYRETYWNGTRKWQSK